MCSLQGVQPSPFLCVHCLHAFLSSRGDRHFYHNIIIVIYFLMSDSLIFGGKKINGDVIQYQSNGLEVHRTLASTSGSQPNSQESGWNIPVLQPSAICCYIKEKEARKLTVSERHNCMYRLLES